MNGSSNKRRLITMNITTIQTDEQTGIWCKME